ncbi:MAG: NnrS family protein [Lentisphaerae bacterium]|nr:NnrS family protein [Lentisphaerota bacterium]
MQPEGTRTPFRLVPLRLLMDEPYRLFFPLGVLWAVLGVGFWILKGHVPFMEPVSTKVHVWLQVYGFMGCFVIGFLGTAIPRFADARYLRPWEVLALLAGSTLTCLAVLGQLFLLAHMAFSATLLLLGAFLLLRMMDHHSPLPVTFLFVPCGLLAALLGSLLQAAVLLGVDWNVQTFASNLLFQGFIIFLVMGVGGFLIRSLLGGAPPSPADAPHRDAGWARFAHEACAVGVFGSFWLEAYVSRGWGAGLRALLVTLEVVWQMRIDRLPRSGKLGAHWLRLALWLLLAGLWGDAVIAPRFPLYRLAMLHLCFVGGFSMVTLAIATRVILSHTGAMHLLQRQYRPFAVAQTLLLLGLLARFGADFVPARYHQHLLYAAAFWLSGLLVWCVFVLARVLAAPPRKVS